MTTSKIKIPVLAPPEGLASASPDRALCQACGRGNEYKRVFTPKGYDKTLLLVLDVFPSEAQQRLVYSLARSAGFTTEQVAYTASVRCGDDEPLMSQLRCCRPFVARVLDGVAPKYVLAMGSAAARSVSNDGKTSNCTKLRGRPLMTPEGRKFYVTYGLTDVVSKRERILEDLRRFLKTDSLSPKVGMLVDGDTAVAVDTEYAPDGSLLTVGLATQIGYSVAEPQEPLFGAHLKHVQSLPPGSTLMGHSLSGDVDRLVELEIARSEWVDGTRTADSLLLSRMLDENRGTGGYDVESLLCSSENVDPWKHKTVAYSKTDATKWPLELRKERCGLDAWASAVLVEQTRYEAYERRLPVEFTHQVAMSLHRIRLAGVYIDRDLFDAKKAALKSELDELGTRLNVMATAKYGMSTFKPSNDGHLRDLLYTRMKLPVAATTKTGKKAVDKKTLKQFEGNEEIKLLLDYNAADKTYTVNIVGLEPHMTRVSSSRAHVPVNINPLGARTGRRSSSGPNFQNWQKSMRSLVVSRWEAGSIITFDYKSLEVFVLAFLAKSAKLRDYFANRGGYTAIAQEMWGKEVTKGTPEYTSAKSIILATNYNMQTKLMSKNLWDLGSRFSSDYVEHEQKTDALRNQYLDMFPELRLYMAARKNELLKYQQVKSLTGRIRHLPVPQGRETPGFGHAVNQAINYPVQSLAADITGAALVDCEAALCNQYGLSLTEYHRRLLTKDWPEMPLIVNEVHDSLVLDVPWAKDDKRTAEAIRLVKERAEQVQTLRRVIPEFGVELMAEMEIGESWGTGKTL